MNATSASTASENQQMTSISPMDWMDMDYDLESIHPNSFLWSNMTKREVSLLQKKYNDFKFYSVLSTVDLFIRTILSFSGVIGHAFTSIVLRDKEFRNATFAMLRYISIADIVFCISMWLMGCLEFRSSRSSSLGSMVLYTHGLKNIRGSMSYFSILLSMALACDRLAAVWFFYWYSKVPANSKKRMARLVAVVLLVVSVVLQMGWSLSIRVGKVVNSREEESYVFEPRVFYLDGRGQIWEKVTTVYYAVFETLFALVTSVMVVWGMFRLSHRHMTIQIDKEKRKREFRTCFLSFFLCGALFLWAAMDIIKKYIFNNFTFAATSFEYDNTYRQASQVLSSLSLQELLNSCGCWFWLGIHGSNFYLYLALHRRFRRVFRGKVCTSAQVGPTALAYGSAITVGDGNMSGRGREK